MTTKERFTRMYQHKEADRIPVLDYPWGDTIARWVCEGMPTPDWISYFDLDRTESISVNNGPRYERKVIEETDKYIIQTSEWGVTMRNWKHNTSTPEMLDFRVKTPADWEEAKSRMTPSDDRIPWESLKRNYPKWRNEGSWIIGNFWFGFDVTHSWFIGTEQLLMAMLDEPEWVMDMFEHELNTDIALMNKIWDAGYTFDELHWPDDMGFKQNQFFSLQMYRDMLKPFHKRAVDWAHNHGIPARLHSCGDIRPFVPDLVEIGFDGLNPLEVKAGMDPIALKQTFGDKLVLHGGINAVLWDKPEEIITAIERDLPILKENGGYIFASDHSIPATVSFHDMKRIMETVRRVGGY
ncbi:MAG: hypothetical protein LBR73_08120 [Oscillospiraceae bacterium]|jgi:uroporphyrinogen decarboxylase|nr:hypothetical protein [Oscillospiraceae bacterium]